jgi:serine/threonine protein kinase
MKKSTGMMYAVKIIGKKKLLQNYADDTSMVNMEVKALAALRHPFIIGMDYSFQTANAALIVMELSGGGTLKSITRFFKDHLLKECDIRFYIAEMAEALHYLHGIGLVYRDLKPDNVLIGLDGHIKLADLGGVSDAGADVAQSSAEDCSALNIYTFGKSTPVYNAENLSAPKRKRSALGTRGYMAPEMLELATAKHRLAAGYTYTVDWWSMGVLVYQLLIGRLPFAIKKEEYSIEAEFELTKTGALLIPEETSDSLVLFICGLLELDDTSRLGYGLSGLEDITTHPFMAPFDWGTNVMKRRCRPPIIPAEDQMFLTEKESKSPSKKISFTKAGKTMSGKDVPHFKTFGDLPLPDWPEGAIEQSLQDSFSDW